MLWFERRFQKRLEHLRVPKVADNPGARPVSASDERRSEMNPVTIREGWVFRQITHSELDGVAAVLCERPAQIAQRRDRMRGNGTYVQHQFD